MALPFKAVFAIEEKTSQQNPLGEQGSGPERGRPSDERLLSDMQCACPCPVSSLATCNTGGEAGSLVLNFSLQATTFIVPNMSRWRLIPVGCKMTVGCENEAIQHNKQINCREIDRAEGQCLTNI